jgi:hypothetical protein
MFHEPSGAMGTTIFYFKPRPDGTFLIPWIPNGKYGVVIRRTFLEAHGRCIVVDSPLREIVTIRDGFDYEIDVGPNYERFPGGTALDL